MKHDRRQRRGRSLPIVIAAAALIVVAAVIVAITRHGSGTPDAAPPPGTLPHTPETYLGVYASNVPASYSQVNAFASATEVRPDVVMYFSSWYTPFKSTFAKTAVQNGAVPLIQIEPRTETKTGVKKPVSLAAIAAGKYDAYLSAYAVQVRSFGHPVIIGFGHEMNGNWYPWGHTRASPAAFVRAWRHIVTTFRELGAKNVTWLWTVNVIDLRHNRIPSPAPWWPGNAYVNWVGIDGYYFKANYAFAPLFGPTIARVRGFTHDPILISETGAAASVGQPAKITNLFTGIHDYGLLGFVWFDSVDTTSFRIDNNPAALAAFRQGAKKYKWPGS
jgi:mannan endo-1,4-beta-mannosidase